MLLPLDNVNYTYRMMYLHCRLEHSDSRFESIRFDSNRFGFPKSRNVRFDCTGCWRLSAKPPIDVLPQLTQQWGTHILRGSTPCTAPIQATPSLPPPGLRPCV